MHHSLNVLDVYTLSGSADNRVEGWREEAKKESVYGSWHHKVDLVAYILAPKVRTQMDKGGDCAVM